jgi:hypothetical protein
MLGTLVGLALPQSAGAQQPPGSAELTRVVGRVEVLRKGQTQWGPAVVGARLVEGDDIRAFSGASAELTLPDKSTVVLAENSRLLVNKLEYDPQNQSRLVLLHLAVGKVRAAIAQASVTLVRLRQSNFAISTPTAVAAARGTIVWVYTDGQASLVAVEPEKGVLLPSRVDCIPLGHGVQAGPPKGQTVFAGSMSTDCGAPTPLQPQLLTLNNPATANAAALVGAVTVPAGVLQAVTFDPNAPLTPPLSFSTNGATPSGTSPSTVGQDVGQNPPPPQEVTAGQNPP